MPPTDAPVYNGYRPTFSDSARAGARLSEDFLQAFKQSLLRDYKDVRTVHLPSSFGLSETVQGFSRLPATNPESGTGPSATQQASSEDQGPTMGQSNMIYPLSLFDSFPDLPSVDVIDHLNQVFLDRVLSRQPFLGGLSAPTRSKLSSTSNLPVYTALSKALVATLFCRPRRYRRWSRNLYTSAVKTFVGAVEFDNRTSRNHLWFQAGILLVTFGMLQSNSTIWHTINMLNGYFFAPYKRCGLLDMRYLEVTPGQMDLGIFTSFYFLVDLLRAIHIGTPPSITPSTLSFPIAGPEGRRYRFENIYESAIFSPQPLDSDLGPDAYLLALLCILSEAVLLLRFLGPLAHPHIDDPEFTVDKQITMLAQTPFRLRELRNTVPPLSRISREYLQQVESLKKSLIKWHESVRSPAPCYDPMGQAMYSSCHTRSAPTSGPASLVDESNLALAYFCRILLEAGPQVLTLPQSNGYPCEIFSGGNTSHVSSPSGSLRGASVIQVNDVAMECAWKILDVCELYGPDCSNHGEEESPNTASRPVSPVPPIWLPLVVFYAGLIVWCRLQGGDAGKGRRRGGIENLISARRRIMKNFHDALHKMGTYYECARGMADCIQNLYL